MTKHLAANTIEPKFATPERQSKLDPFADKLAGWLKTEGGKSRKQRRTMKQLHADLLALGFTGSYARVAAFARRWRADRQREQQTTGRGTFVPLHFDPGDAFQFDWSEDFAVLGGERTKLQMAHIGPVAVSFRSFESNTRHQGDRIWQRYTATSSSGMQFASRSPAA